MPHCHFSTASSLSIVFIVLHSSSYRIRFGHQGVIRLNLSPRPPFHSSLRLVGCQTLLQSFIRRRPIVVPSSAIRMSSRSAHPPFKKVEAERPDFETDKTWHMTKTPGPEWRPGGIKSTNDADLPGVKEGLWKPTSNNTRSIEPTKDNIGMMYKMMISAITPRPIAFVSSKSEKTNVTNLAPFSYFSMVAHNPPVVSVSFTHPSKDKRKETCSNILGTKEFCISIISEPFLEAANYTCVDAPPEVTEWSLSGLTQIKSETVGVPYVGESGFSMECQLIHHYDIHNDDGDLTGTIVLGRVNVFHVREDLLVDGVVDTGKLLPVSRLGGITYGRTTGVFELPRPIWEKEKDLDDVKKAVERGEVKGADEMDGSSEGKL